jgi:hypothetical protein
LAPTKPQAPPNEKENIHLSVFLPLYSEFARQDVLLLFYCQVVYQYPLLAYSTFVSHFNHTRFNFI